MGTKRSVAALLILLSVCSLVPFTLSNVIVRRLPIARPFLPLGPAIGPLLSLGGIIRTSSPLQSAGSSGVAKSSLGINLLGHGQIVQGPVLQGQAVVVMDAVGLDIIGTDVYGQLILKRHDELSPGHPDLIGLGYNTNGQYVLDGSSSKNWALHKVKESKNVVFIQKTKTGRSTTNLRHILILNDVSGLNPTFQTAGTVVSTQPSAVVAASALPSSITAVNVYQAPPAPAPPAPAPPAPSPSASSPNVIFPVQISVNPLRGEAETEGGAGQIVLTQQQYAQLLAGFSGTSGSSSSATSSAASSGNQATSSQVFAASFSSQGQPHGHGGGNPNLDY